MSKHKPPHDDALFQLDFNDVVEEVVQKIGRDFERLASDYDDDYREVLIDTLPDFLFMATDQPTVDRWFNIPPLDRQRMLYAAVKGY